MCYANKEICLLFQGLQRETSVPGDYAVLAPIYDQIGMGDFARNITSVLIDYAQHIDWLGRRIIVLGCGTGASLEYLSQYPYTLTGVDSSAEMLEIARKKLEDSGANLKWHQADIRDMGSAIAGGELVMALNVMNELNSLRDLEAVFGGVAKVLESGKLFLFDMFTVQGLTEDGVRGDGMLYDNGKTLTVFGSNEYDYERQMHTRQYLIFQRNGEAWHRAEAKRILRGFPIQAVASLLQRSGFNLRTLLNTNLDPYEPGVSRAPRVIFVAERQ
jgi:SAM-dependent methyltransferase